LPTTDAVSSVVAVVLLVAITIVLASLAAVFVLDVPLPGDDSPQARFDVTQANESVSGMGWGGNETEVVTVEHVGGDSLDESTVNITVNGFQAYNDSAQDIWTGSGEINSSDTARVAGYDGGNQALQEGDEIEIVWTSADEDSSAVLRRYTVE
jgi:FlaG/FlaF family flagellin (archaellin)